MAAPDQFEGLRRSTFGVGIYRQKILAASPDLARTKLAKTKLAKTKNVTSVEL